MNNDFKCNCFLCKKKQRNEYWAPELPVYFDIVDGKKISPLPVPVSPVVLPFSLNYKGVAAMSTATGTQTAPEKRYVPRTQKAKGLRALQSYSKSVPTFEIFSADNVEPSYLVGKFVRPCPMRPRHGFVDSRIINDLDEARVIIKETLEADPEGEFIVMPFVPAEYSGIWTPGSLAIGKGTDGATAGKSAVTLPILGEVFGGFIDSRDLFKNAGVTNTPYLELLWKEGRSYKVQLRDGPAIPQTIDYIPSKTTVKNVELAKGDLLVWESTMKAAKAGTVVYHPNGSLASHYAIHAVLNGIPVLISREPKVGEIIEPVGDANPAINIKQIQSGFVYATQIKIDYEDAAKMMLVGMHNIVLWRGKQDFLLGASLGFAYRLTMVASLGEVRHMGMKSKGVPRNSVYGHFWNMTLESYTKHLFRRSLYAFIFGEWRSSFGGHSWFKFARWAALIYNSVLKGNVEEALEALNQVVHSAHNTGWGFDKFLQKETLDATAESPVKTAIKIAPLLYKILEEGYPQSEQLYSKLKHKKPIQLPDVEISKGGYVVVKDRDVSSKELKSLTQGVSLGVKAPKKEYKFAQIAATDTNLNGKKSYVQVVFDHPEGTLGKKEGRDISFFTESFILNAPDTQLFNETVKTMTSEPYWYQKQSFRDVPYFQMKKGKKKGIYTLGLLWFDVINMEHGRIIKGDYVQTYAY